MQSSTTEKTRLFSLAVALMISIGIPTVARAQLASLLVDLNPFSQPGSSFPEFLGVVDGTTFFTAQTSTLGTELWSTQGSPETTSLTLDACSGVCSSYMTVLGRTASQLFLARTSSQAGGWAEDLIVASGDSASARVFLSASTDREFRQLLEPGNAAVLGSKLLFGTTSSSGEIELLTFDGIESEPSVLLAVAGTMPFVGLRSTGARVYFWRPTGIDSGELWTTDGSQSGASVVMPESGARFLDSAVIENGVLILLLRTAEGIEVWRSDGTSAGTVQVADLDGFESSAWNIRPAGEVAYFFGSTPATGQELWRSDGTPAGTFPLSAFENPLALGPDRQRSTLRVVGDDCYLLALNDGTNLWRSGAGQGSLLDLGRVCDGDCNDQWIEASGTRIFFLRESLSSGEELWTSDGSISGTRLFKDACPGSCSGRALRIATDPTRFSYAVWEPGVGFLPFMASEPWGEPEPMFDPIRRIPTVEEWYDELRRDVRRGIFVDETVFFRGYDPIRGSEPWSNLGGTSGSLLLADIRGPLDSDSSIPRFVSDGARVAFESVDTGTGLPVTWLSDGTEETTRSVATASPFCPYSSGIEPVVGGFVNFGCGEAISFVDPSSNEATSLASVGGHSLAATSSSEGLAIALIGTSAGWTFWRSDGSVEGTYATLTLPSNLSFVNGLWPVSGRFLFTAGAPFQLYSLTADLQSFVALTPSFVYPSNGILPLNADSGFFSHGSEVWRTDGTPGGTSTISMPGNFHSLKAATSSSQGFDLLTTDDSIEYRVWSVEGPLAPSLRSSFVTGATSSGTLPMLRMANRLYMALPGNTPGIWMLRDGEAQVSFLAPHEGTGFYVGAPWLGSSGDSLIFQGCEDEHGCELWRSDDSDSGTRLLHDIRPGPESSYPGQFSETASHLYMMADDGLHGFEPWVVSRIHGSECTPDPRSLCLQGGRFQVVSTWRDFDGQSGGSTAVGLSADTGYFWFFDDDNVELIVKVLDGLGFNGHHWVFQGALSNVEYYLTVTDSESGVARRYFNPATRFASSGDITAFGPLGAHLSVASAPEAALPTAALSPLDLQFSSTSETSGTCAASPTRFCILGNRFAVEATWRDFEGRSGEANAGTLTDDTGFFWFFDDANVEVVLKAIDGGSLNGHFWIFYGALSNVEYAITVTDTVAGGSRVYRNPLGSFGSFGDIEAFPAD